MGKRISVCLGYVRPAEASVLALQKFWGQVMYLDLSKVE